jgi:hypothetical protein
MNFNQSALANWPEDEARASAALGLELFEEEGRDGYHQWLIRERRVIANVFDGDQTLIGRFMAKFNAMTAPTTNLYF